MTTKLPVTSRRRPAGKAIALAAALAWSATCAPAWSLDLLQAYEAALAQDASIRAVRAATDARRERIPQARGQLLPNLSASASRNRNSLERTLSDIRGNPVTDN